MDSSSDIGVSLAPDGRVRTQPTSIYEAGSLAPPCAPADVRTELRPSNIRAQSRQPETRNSKPETRNSNLEPPTSPAPELSLQLLQADVDRRRASMRARPGMSCPLQLADQLPHLGHRKHLAGLDRSLAGHDLNRLTQHLLRRRAHLECVEHLENRLRLDGSVSDHGHRPHDAPISSQRFHHEG